MRKERLNKAWIEQLDENILNHLNDTHLSSTDLAQLMGLTQRQFYRKVKAITRQTPNEYLNKIRFQKAYEYLQKDEFDTIANIAYAVGFKDASYFSRKFKDHYGISPQEV